MREKLALYRNPELPNLLETALAAAHEEGMEFVAEQEGVSWSQQTHKEKEKLAEEARASLYEALGLTP